MEESKFGHKHINWTTNNEIDFLERIGTFGPHSKPKKPLLQKYIEAVDTRTEWNKMKKNKIIEKAKELLNQCTGE